MSTKSKIPPPPSDDEPKGPDTAAGTDTAAAPSDELPPGAGSDLLADAEDDDEELRELKAQAREMAKQALRQRIAGLSAELEGGRKAGVQGRPDWRQDEGWQKDRGFLWSDQLTARGRVIRLVTFGTPNRGEPGTKEFQPGTGTATHEYVLQPDRATDDHADAARAILRAKANLGEPTELAAGMVAGFKKLRPPEELQKAGSAD